MEAIKKILVFLLYLPRNLGALLVTAYQKTLSPDHSSFKILFPYGYCKFTPSCSQYTKEAIKRQGLILGSIKGFWRILRCNPCSKGGVDPVK